MSSLLVWFLRPSKSCALGGLPSHPPSYSPDFDLRLECTAPNRQSKYTTVEVLRVIMCHEATHWKIQKKIIIIFQILFKCNLHSQSGFQDCSFIIRRMTCTIMKWVIKIFSFFCQSNVQTTFFVK